MMRPEVMQFALEGIGYDGKSDDQPICGMLDALADDIETFADSLTLDAQNGKLLQALERWVARTRVASALVQDVAPGAGGAL